MLVDIVAGCAGLEADLSATESSSITKDDKL